MGKLNFEEYRQPWETGPHWELKREFMEKYQDDFPEDRLLCLAQAYSNIELLHCSYPDPVMLQIHELSKQLQGCKRFRDVKKNFPKDEPELQARPGKRSAPDDVKKPFKFIKFYSVGTDQATDDSAFGDNVYVDTPKPETPSTSSLNVPSGINSTPPLESSDCSTKHKLLIMSLSQSPDFKLITEIAAERENLQIKSTHAIEEIECLVESLNLQKQVHYKFVNVAVGNTPASLCEFYIGDTLMSIGRCANEKSSRLIAAAYAMEALTNVSNLPVKALKDLKSNTTDKETISFLHKFLQELKKANRTKLSSTEKMISTVASLNCASDVTYFSREDLESPLNSRLYYNDLVIKKVLICTGQSSGKKKAKSAAANQVIPFLVQFFNGLPEDKYKILDESSNMCSLEDPILSAPLKTDKVVSTSDSRPHRNVNLKQSSVKDPKINIVGSPSVNPGYFRINYRLLNNSLEKNFAILDTTAITPDTQIHTPQKTLNHSAQYCKKSLSYDVYDCDPIPDGPLFRCDLILDGENMGFGAGSTKNEAKTTATVAVLKILEKHFYTIKVKSELDESFVIKRSQMMNTIVASDIVSDSNVGCKMLKMMGWTGGGIGKTGGITEPITASEHRFHQGLGFLTNNSGEMKKFQQNIESLLREFSQTDTTSDLIFATDFTKDERKIIHKIACKFGLIGNSKGKNDHRQLFVRHKLTTTELLHHLIRAGGCTHKYELVDKST